VRVIIVLGAGDGTAVVRMARSDPRAFVIGIDANADRMRDASRRSARAQARGGLSNAMFVVAAAEALPPELAGRADLVHVTLPWGSLLRGVAHPESWAVDALRGLLRPRGHVRMLLSIADRDRRSGMQPFRDDDAQALATRYRDRGWRALDVRPATRDDVAATGSAWAKRLGVPERRSAWWLELATGDTVHDGTDNDPCGV
jgi:16S rRNA (adenine(1408)-N(1))-methyltransferase